MKKPKRERTWSGMTDEQFKQVVEYAADESMKIQVKIMKDAGYKFPQSHDQKQK